MKMVKKILLGLTATAAVIGFASCGISDDPENAITGSGNNYKVDYENTDTEMYRAYETTDLKHAGAIVKVTFDKKDVGKSKMGVIFGLQEDKKDDSKTFCIIGLGTAKDNNFYASRFSKVTDIQAENFGAPKGGAEEYPATPIASHLTEGFINASKQADGSFVYYVAFKAMIDGSYQWALLNVTTDDQVKKIDLDKQDPWELNYFAKGSIPGVFDAVDDEKKITQHQMAVYAMIAPNQHLTGSWKYFDMYKAAEEIAE